MRDVIDVLALRQLVLFRTRSGRGEEQREASGFVRIEDSMAKRTIAESTESPAQALPFRPVIGGPSSVFIVEVLAHLKETARPETCDLLFRNKLSKSTKFKIIRKIDLDQRKRPEGDRAPCPMCTTNRFLSGALVFLPELQCCAVIGHCCADKEQLDYAEREYKWRTQRDYEESLLWSVLPLIPKRGEVLKQLRSPVEEARRVYRKFRREVPSIHSHLRELKARRGGHLVVTELLDEKESQIQIYGPAGFDTRRAAERVREIEFGAFRGQIAVSKDYNPVRDLDTALRILFSLEETPTEERALDFIVSMSEAQRRAAVAIVRSIDSAYKKLVVKLEDFGNFFARENIKLINSYGTHPSNPFHIEAKYETLRGQPRITLQHRGERCQLLIGSQLYDTKLEWPQPPQDQ